MIHIVALRKAALAGVAGAFAWELAIRAIQLGGVTFFDIVAFPDGPAIAWWTTGMAIHALVGAIWAIFYAYFFWSSFDWPPAVQGMAFSALPAFLALLIAYPQLQMMHLPGPVALFDPVAVLRDVGWREVVGLLLGHLVYGGVLGALYTHPVGYPAARPRRPPIGAGPLIISGSQSRRAPPRHRFLFATGIDGLGHRDWRTFPHVHHVLHISTHSAGVLSRAGLGPAAAAVRASARHSYILGGPGDRHGRDET